MLKELTGKNTSAAIILAVICVVILSACIRSEKDKISLTMRQSVPSEILGWNLQDTVETYDRESIFGYMNGAGEVYRSYDFREVVVFRFTRSGEPDMTVEIFDMGSSEDAYGVFSYARESEESGIGQGYEYRVGLLCFWQSRYFACIKAERETSDSKEAVFALARKIDEQLPSAGIRPKLVEYFPEENLLPQSIRYLHIHPSLNYHYFLAEDNILNLSRDTRAVLAAYEPGQTFLLCVQYPSAMLADEGYHSFVENYIPEARETGIAEIENGKWVAVKLEAEYVIVALDVAGKDGASQLVEAFRSKLVKATL